MYLLLYVDDILITGNLPSTIVSFISLLSKELELKDPGPLHYILGIKVQRSSTGLHLTYQKYIVSLLHRTNMLDCQPTILILLHARNLLSNPLEFRKIIGSVQYLTMTRWTLLSLSIILLSLCLVLVPP